MFFLVTTRLPNLFPSIKSITWNYSEAGHGKGAPDGIGGVLKPTADRLVAEGNDVQDFDTLFSVLKNKISKVLLLRVDSNMINEESLWLQLQQHVKIQRVVGTLCVHQFCWEENCEDIVFRKLSCFKCKVMDICKHQYHFKTIASYQTRLDMSLERIALVEETNTDGQISADNTTDVLTPELDNTTEALPNMEHVTAGIFILVRISGKIKEGRYVAVCAGDIDENGEVEVMFMQSIGEEKTCFKSNENDSAFVHFTDLISVLPSSTLLLKGNRVYYQFQSPVDIDEQ